MNAMKKPYSPPQVQSNQMRVTNAMMRNLAHACLRFSAVYQAALEAASKEAGGMEMMATAPPELQTALANVLNAAGDVVECAVDHSLLEPVDG